MEKDSLAIVVHLDIEYTFLSLHRPKRLPNHFYHRSHAHLAHSRRV